MAASAQITGSLYPILCDLGGADAREVSQFSTRSGVLRASRGGGVRPARFFEPQVFGPHPFIPRGTATENREYGSPHGRH